VACSSQPNGIECHLDTWGREFLNVAHVNVLAILSLVIVLIFAAIRKSTGRKTEVTDLLKLFIALLGFGSGLIVATVFLLTNPPAFCELSDDTRSAIGGVTFLVLCGLGINEVSSFFNAESGTKKKSLRKRTREAP
jgi:hypothetical protein